MKRVAITCALSLSLAASVAAAATPSPQQNGRLRCRDVPEAEATATALTNPRDIRAVEEVKPETPASETERPPQRWGARILLRAQEGVTAEWLQRVAECHLSQLATSTRTADQRSPLDVRGAAVVVQSTGDGFSVEVTSPDMNGGREILARARALAPRGPAGRATSP